MKQQHVIATFLVILLTLSAFIGCAHTQKPAQVQAVEVNDPLSD